MMDVGYFAGNILYVKSINSEWKLDAETPTPPFKERCESLAEIQSKGSAWNYLSNLTLSKYNLDCQTPEISKLIDSQCAWKIVLSNSKEKLAVLQDSHIEIRTSECDFTSVADKWAIPSKDLFPQWRSLAWSPCDTLLAFSDSFGDVFLYSTTGEQLSHVVQPKNQTCDLGGAVCSLIFKGRRSLDDIEDQQHWVHELLVLTYQGVLTTFIISLEGDYRVLNIFNFDGGYPNGVIDAVFVPTSSLLLIGGGTFFKHGDPVAKLDKEDKMLKHGISAWRILSGYPYYKNIFDYDFESFSVNKFSSKGWWWPWSFTANGDKVFMMTLSPDCKTLVTVHTSEYICVWNLPSLQLFKKVSIKEYLGRNYFDSETLQILPPKKNKEILNTFNIVSLAWWSNQDLIISGSTGSLTVSNVGNFVNRLGPSPEFFEPDMSLMRLSDECFCLLECEKIHGSSRGAVLGESEALIDNLEINENFIDGDENLNNKMGGRFLKLFRKAFYYITDFDTFRPQKREFRLLRRTYRLICLKSTTPQELYSNMLNSEEYGEALLLAKKYSLDCDLTYQKQWKKIPASVSSIQDYLWKITKRSWVLHECLETVPDNLDAMEGLLRYGLGGTDLEAVLAAGQDDDDDKFIFCEYSSDYKPLDCEEEGSTMAEENRIDLLKQIDFNNLTFNQKELCRVRLKLLGYLDKLQTYKEILGGKHMACEKYEKDFFKSFRKDDIVKSAMKFAQLSNISALSSMFTHHGDEILPHRLPILNHLPETTPPSLFYHLLPRISVLSEKRVVEDWREVRWRNDPDWAELFCRSLNTTPLGDSGDFIYKENPSLLEFRGKVLTEEQISLWFKKRSLELEKKSGQVDCSYELLNLGIQNNIQDLTALHDDFALMETLVYECQVDPSFSFESLMNMTEVEKIHCMMAKTANEMYIKNFKRWVVPYLKQQESNRVGSYYSLLKQYLMSLKDLAFAEFIFLETKNEKSIAIIEDVHQMFSLAAECLYANTCCSQLHVIKSIIQCLPDLDVGSEENHIKSAMSGHLLGAEILKRNGINQNLAQIRGIQSSEDATLHIMTRLARISARKNPPMSQKELECLLSDMCMLQENVFTSITKTRAYEIFVGALLCSGNLNHITIGGAIIQSSFKFFSGPDFKDQKLSSKKFIKSSIKDSFRSFAYSSVSSSSSSLVFNCPISNEFMNCSIDQSKSVELVLQAAMEYFNSSPDVLHDNMKLARSCLELIKDPPLEIQKELNLIEALAMLKCHGISEFPAHLRIAGDRLEYIKKVLKKKSMMYKSYSKLLELGKLLDVGKGDDILLQGQIFELVAEHALETKDFHICFDTCKKMMLLNYGDGWNICRSLAEDTDFCDESSKSALFDFIILHAPDCFLDEILVSHEKHEITALCLKVMNSMASVDLSMHSISQATKTESIKSIENVFIDQTKHMFGLTKAAFDHIGDSQWWSNAAMELKRMTAPETRKKLSFQNDGISLDCFIDQTSHPFYRTLKVQSSLNSNENKECANIDIYTNEKSRDPIIDVNELLLQIYLLKGNNYNDDTFCEPITEVLLVLAESVLPQETSLGLFYLLTLPNLCTVKKCFNRLPKTFLCYQVATYFFAIKIAPWTMTFGKSSLFSHVIYPKLLIHYVENQAQGMEWPFGKKILFEHMSYYRELVIDYQESQTLTNMDRGIDVTRFVTDMSYKRETILGMVLSLDDKLFKSALNFASKYGVCTRDLYMAHLGYLFEDSCGLTTEQIQRRIKELDMLTILNENPAWFAQMMREQILPLIDGQDLDRLMLYYSCLIPAISQGNKSYDLDERPSYDCEDDTKVTVCQKIEPHMHVEMLKKLKGVCQGLNYKDLTHGGSCIENILIPILNEINVEIFAKFSKHFVDKNGRVGSPSFVYKCYASKVFNTAIVGNEGDWMIRYKACQEIIQKLTPESLVEFVDENLFGIKITKMMKVESRKEILKEIMKHSKQQLSLSKRNNPQGISEWEETVDKLQKGLYHLNKMSSRMVSKLAMTSDAKRQQYAIDFDLTQSRPLEVKDLIKKMILEGESVEFVNDMIKCLSPEEFLCRNLYVEVLEELCSSFNKQKAEYHLERLKLILNEILKHKSMRNSLISPYDVFRDLKNVVANSSNIDPCFKLQILNIIKGSSHHEDDKDITFSQTCTLLSMLDYCVDNLTVEKLLEEPQRNLIFNTLLECMTADKIPSIVQLLSIWHSAQNSENLWHRLLRKLVIAPPIGVDISHDTLKLASEFIGKHYMNAEEIKHVADLMATRDKLSACKILLISSDEELICRALPHLQSLQEETEDEELFTLLLKHGKLSKYINLPFYHKLATFMVTSGSETLSHLIPSPFKDLAASGHKIEAGTLYMSIKSIHRSLRTFDGAIKFSDKFLSK